MNEAIGILLIISMGVNVYFFLTIGIYLTELSEKLDEVGNQLTSTAEDVDNQFKISKEDKDAFAINSHEKAISVIKEGKFKFRFLNKNK
tara:strand:+ start:589 stop:855 length:267 start_codon:yes stop_codon:yes gene_type:complete